MNPSLTISSVSSTTTSAFTFGLPSGNHVPSSLLLLHPTMATAAAIAIDMKNLFIESFYCLDCSILVVLEFAHLEAAEPCLSA